MEDAANGFTGAGSPFLVNLPNRGPRRIAPAKNVFMNMVDTAIASSAVPIANCEPPLNPNQPNHRINTPIVTSGIEEAANGLTGLGDPAFANLPILGPSNIAPAKAAAPPVE